MAFKFFCCFSRIFFMFCFVFLRFLLCFSPFCLFFYELLLSSRISLPSFRLNNITLNFFILSAFRKHSFMDFLYIPVSPSIQKPLSLNRVRCIDFMRFFSNFYSILFFSQHPFNQTTYQPPFHTRFSFYRHFHLLENFLSHSKLFLLA